MKKVVKVREVVLGFRQVQAQMANTTLHTAERMSALIHIRDYPEIAISDLAKAEMVKTATMSRMVTSLVDDGYAERVENENDGRGTLIRITNAGKKVLAVAEKFGFK